MSKQIPIVLVIIALLPMFSFGATVDESNTPEEIFLSAVEDIQERLGSLNKRLKTPDSPSREELEQELAELQKQLQDEFSALWQSAPPNRKGHVEDKVQTAKDAADSQFKRRVMKIFGGTGAILGEIGVFSLYLMFGAPETPYVSETVDATVAVVVGGAGGATASAAIPWFIFKIRDTIRELWHGARDRWRAANKEIELRRILTLMKSMEGTVSVEEIRRPQIVGNRKDGYTLKVLTTQDTACVVYLAETSLLETNTLIREVRLQIESRRAPRD